MYTVTTKYILFYLTVNRTAADEQGYHCVLALHTGVITKSLPVLRPSRYCVKLLSTEDYGFRPSSTDVDRGTTLLNALKVCCLSICFFIFGVQTVSEIVCYGTNGLEVWKIACFNAERN